MERERREVLLQGAEQAVVLAGKHLFDREKARQIGQKGRADFVTRVDYMVQEELRQALAALDPEIPLLSEEQAPPAVKKGGPLWILDPVDGTTNLIYGLQKSAVSLALAEEGQIVAGVVLDPFAGELFTAQVGGGAFCNGQKIQVSEAGTLEECLCIVGTNPGARQRRERLFRQMDALYRRCLDLRNLGSAALELCAVAAGRADVFIEYGLKPWDHAAAGCILREAGGRLTTMEGTELPITGGDSLAASNGKVHQQLLELLTLDC